MGIVILNPETQEVQHRADLAELPDGYEGCTAVTVYEDFSLLDKAVDWNTLTLMDDLPGLRAKQWTAAKEYYQNLCNTSFQYPGVGTIQIDTTSREAIRLLVDEAKDQLEQGNTSWQTAFKNEENEYVPVTAQQIIEIYRAMREHLGVCYARCQTLGGLIAVADSKEAILAIDVTAGYP